MVDTEVTLNFNTLKIYMPKKKKSSEQIVTMFLRKADRERQGLGTQIHEKEHGRSLGSSHRVKMIPDRRIVLGFWTCFCLS